MAGLVLAFAGARLCWNFEGANYTMQLSKSKSIALVVFMAIVFAGLAAGGVHGYKWLTRKPAVVATVAPLTAVPPPAKKAVEPAKKAVTPAVVAPAVKKEVPVPRFKKPIILECVQPGGEAQ